MYGIVELRHTGENDWKAKFQGNYGLYTIKITTDGEKTKNFSCSCPSDYYPCKHIAMIEEAIAKKMAGGEVNVQDLIGKVSAEKLREFIIIQAVCNDELLNAVLLEFGVNASNTKGNKYSSLIRKALSSVQLHEDDDDYDGYYDDYDDYDDEEEGHDIEVLDQWFDKIRDYLDDEQYDEAVLICKACIEEYSHWLYKIGGYSYQKFFSEYQSFPFAIIEEAAGHTDKKELLDYCRTEMQKEKYAETGFNFYFLRLFEKLAIETDPGVFIALQDELFAKIENKSSGEALNILQRKIDFYRRIGQDDKAWSVIEENIQIKSFRLEVIKEKIKKQNFTEAKKLINDYIAEKKEVQKSRVDESWYEMLLEIAQKEKDMSAIRGLSFFFIEKRFNEKYYKIYKESFDPKEWTDKREKLFLYYDNDKSFNSSAADLLAAEHEEERLLNYVEKNLSAQELEKYYKHFATAFPEKTLELFWKVLIKNAEFTGQTHYEYVLSLLKKMSNIEGGKKAAAELIMDFKIRYKNRKLMIKILNRFR